MNDWRERGRKITQASFRYVVSWHAEVTSPKGEKKEKTEEIRKRQRKLEIESGEIGIKAEKKYREETQRSDLRERERERGRGGGGEGGGRGEGAAFFPSG